jgi:RNA polymerase sigma factor (TIGR02999 family)
MIAGQNSPSGEGDLTPLLLSWSGGDKSALDQLLPFVYAELRRLASRALRRERPGHTLNTTDLVHEAYLVLVHQKQVNFPTRVQFFAIAATVMRNILVNRAKRRKASKRDGGYTLVLGQNIDLRSKPEIDVLALDQALDKLARLDPRQSRIVELRFFAGLTHEEIAGLMDMSLTSVKREWWAAKMLLYHELNQGALI